MIYFTFCVNGAVIKWCNLLFLVSLPPTGKPYIAPIESVVRKPTSIAQIHSTSHVTTGINSVQLKASHNSPVSVAVVNMGRCPICIDIVQRR